MHTLRIKLISLAFGAGIALTTAAQSPINCQESAPHRQFDFWLGQWSVYDNTDTLRGHNRIESVQSGCALRERWRSVTGGSGESLNYYDPKSEQWHQLWVDNGVSVIAIAGELSADGMRMEGWITYLMSGQRHPFRALWQEMDDGRVRQFFEQADDKGQWQTWFEGFYRRGKAVSTGHSS